jgi:DNA-binding NtrC family response regulator
MQMPLEILVLDDEKIVCTRLRPALEKEGYRVETFIDSLQAKQRLEEHRFDIVVTDLRMADIDGLELFRFINEKWPGTKVIIISGFATVELTREALQAGVSEIVSKPFKISQLKDIIDKVSSEIRRSRE